jgi:hypothetical protein
VSVEELGILASLVNDDNSRWAERAIPQQMADARAIFEEERPNWHFITRPRGGSKTTDIAGVALAWLVGKAGPFDRGFVVAANAEQATLVIDAASGFIFRTPELEGAVTAEAERLVGANGAWVRVMSLSDSGSWGKMNTHLLICDEFAQWPDTRGAKRVWQAVRSTTQKTPGCRLVILTSAGEPSHWSFEEVFQGAQREIERSRELRRNPFWRISEMPGPVPWQDPEELEQLRHELPPSAYDRLILNIWSEAEDRAIAPEDYEAAARECRRHGAPPAGIRGGGFRLRDPATDVRYVITVDVGTRNDATVICVAHREPLDPEQPNVGHRVVVDHIDRWQGSKKRHVQIADIRHRVVFLSAEYNRARVYADPDQFVDSIQQLNRLGVRASEWAFTATSVGQVATSLVQAFHNRLIVVPDSPMLKDELLKVRLRETSPGVTRLDHDHQSHDDQAVTIGMACHILLGRAWSVGAAFKEFLRRDMAHTDEDSLAAKVQQSRRGLGSLRRELESVQSRCDHRWRDLTCVFCGSERPRVEEAS